MFNESILPRSPEFLDQLEHNFQQSNSLIQVVSDCTASGDSTFTDPKSISVTLNHVLKTLSSVEKQIGFLWDEIRKSCAVKPSIDLLDELEDNLQSAWHITQIVADYAESADNISPNNRSMFVALSHTLELLNLVKSTTLKFWQVLNKSAIKRDVIGIKIVKSTTD